MLTCANCGRECPEGFEFCPACGARLEPADRFAEERKLVSVLFADVTGSTELGERLDPERLRSVLESYFSAMAAAIRSWGGTVEKFIGDAVMAVFGLDGALEVYRQLRARPQTDRVLSSLEAIDIP